MVFERGTASSTFEVMDRLTDFMTRVPGWQLWANIDGYGHRDFVYYSTGSVGKNDIYVRQRVAQAEPFIYGADQFDYGNGDTGFLNFFSYIYFPQDGDAYSGASEIGSFGPRLYWWNGDSNWFRWWKQDYLSQRSGGSTHVYYGSLLGEEEPPGYQEDYKCEERRRWDRINGGPSESDVYGGTQKSFCSDGKKTIFVSDSIYGRIYKYSLARGCGGFNSDGEVTNGTLIGTYSGLKPCGFLCYFEDRSTRTPYLFVMGDNNAESGKIRLTDNVYLDVPNPPWPPRVRYGDDDDNYLQESRAVAWDGNNFIYVLRGGHTNSGWYGYSSDWPDWARYDIINNEWKATTVPENPVFRGINIDIGSGSGWGVPGGTRWLTFLKHDVTGFDYNMLIFNQNNTVYRLKLDINTGLPLMTDLDWHQYGGISTAGSDTYTKGQWYPNRANQGRVFCATDGMQSRQVNGIWERFPGSGIRAAMYADLHDSDVTYRAIDMGFYPTFGTNYSRNCFIDGYMCRVRTSIGADTEYIFVGDEDRIIVATKSAQIKGQAANEWNVAYMGAFNSNYSTTPYAELAEDVKAGPSRLMRLTNVSGEFIEHNRYFIVAQNGPATAVKDYGPDGRTRLLAPSESIRITKTGPDFVIASVKHNYRAGAKIAIDPQPVGLFFTELEKFQATNVAQRLYDDLHGSDDPAKQMYTIPIGEATVKTGVVPNATFPIYEMILTSGADDEGNYCARETRGTMKGMYVVGKNTSALQSEDTIALSDGNSYLILEIPDYINKMVLVGPIND